MKILDFKSFSHAIHLHKSCPPHSNPDLCRLIFQASLGARVSETCSLRSNTVLLPKSCKCSRNAVCNIILSSCFDKLQIKHTKTGQTEKFLLSSLHGCYFSLLHNHDYISVPESYNQFLKSNFNITSHDVRRFLPNLHTNTLHQHNTGSWSSRNLQNLNKYYLDSELAKFVALHKIFIDLSF